VLQNTTIVSKSEIGQTEKQKMFASNCQVLRTRLIDHIIKMKQNQPDYAREALKYYDKLLPWAELMQGVREALKNNS
jgi:hypothetical protein